MYDPPKIHTVKLEMLSSNYVMDSIGESVNVHYLVVPHNDGDCVV